MGRTRLALQQLNEKENGKKYEILKDIINFKINNNQSHIAYVCMFVFVRQDLLSENLVESNCSNV